MKYYRCQDKDCRNVIPENKRLNVAFGTGRENWKCPYCRGKLKEIDEKTLHFLDWCYTCKRKHRMMYKPCPTCNTYETPQPVSDRVYESCGADYSCDGCIAYRDHTNPY